MSEDRPRIDVGDGLVLGADDYQWIIYEKWVSGPGTKTPGKVRYKPRSFHRSLRGAVRACLSLKLRRSKVSTLAELSDTLDTLTHDMLGRMRSDV